MTFLRTKVMSRHIMSYAEICFNAKKFTNWIYFVSKVMSGQTKYHFMIKECFICSCIRRLYFVTLHYFYNTLHLCTFILCSNYDSLCFMFGNAWLWVWNTGQHYVMWVTELHQILQYSMKRIVLFNKGLIIAKKKFLLWAGQSGKSLALVRILPPLWS